MVAVTPGRKPLPFPALSSLGSLSPSPLPVPVLWLTAPPRSSRSPPCLCSPPCLSPWGPLVSPSPAPGWKPLLTETGTHRGILRGLRKKFPLPPRHFLISRGRGRQQLWPSLVPAPGQEAWPGPFEDEVKAELGAHHGGPAGPWRAVPPEPSLRAAAQPELCLLGFIFLGIPLVL